NCDGINAARSVAGTFRSHFQRMVAHDLPVWSGMAAASAEFWFVARNADDLPRGCAANVRHVSTNADRLHLMIRRPDFIRGRLDGSDHRWISIDYRHGRAASRGVGVHVS